MTILVVGGAGYIGGITVEHLLRCGNEVVVLDNLSTGHKEAVSSSAIFYQNDLNNIDVLDQILKRHKIDVVIYLSALSSISGSYNAPARYFDENFNGGLRLLESMLKNGVDYLVFSSTAAVYGNLHESPITETAKLCPLNPYGLSKLAFERVLSRYNQDHRLRYVTLRYFNVGGAAYGLAENHQPETHLIPLSLMVALGLRSVLTVFGSNYKTLDGTAIRDYVHVKDIAAANLAAVNYLISGGKSVVLNVGSGIGHSVNQVIEITREVTSRVIPTEFNPPRKGDPAVLIASNKEVQAILNWKPEQSNIKTIISDAWSSRRIHS